MKDGISCIEMANSQAKRICKHKQSCRGRDDRVSVGEALGVG